MNRSFLVGLLAIAALLGVSVGVISWATGDSPAPIASAAPDADAPTTGTSPAAPVTQVPAPAAPQTVNADAAAGLLALAVQRPVPPPATPAAPSRSAQDALPPATHHARINFRGEMAKGFAGLQKQVARCAAPEASFTLDVETVAGGVKIVDAKLESRGQASDAGVTCARSALRGHVVPAPSAEPGKHWQMPFAVRSAT